MQELFVGSLKVVNIGLEHREAGVGVARAPMDCFVQALEGLVETLSPEGTVAGE